MKVIDAVWEKRNLGICTKEIVIEEKDNLEEITSNLNEISAEYLVVKVPAGKAEAMFQLEKRGFHFIEANIHVTHNLKDIVINKMTKRIIDSVSYEEMKDKDRKELIQEIKKGLFYTDRIYLDNYFTKEQAANRYAGWIQDEYKKGSQIFKLLYKGDTIGFFTLKDLGDGVYYPFLAGMYQKYQRTGLGISFNYKPIEEAIRRDGKMISTYVSSNNPNSLRIHAMYGFQFHEINYVYIQHS